jgi:hypothetical protein
MEAMNAAATAQHQQPPKKKSSHMGDGIDVTMIRRFISLLEFVWRRRLLLHAPACSLCMPLAATGHLPLPAGNNDLALGSKKKNKLSPSYSNYQL